MVPFGKSKNFILNEPGLLLQRLRHWLARGRTAALPATFNL
jgi:hypothetical protein